jgi:signal transduction histidine kinase
MSGNQVLVMLKNNSEIRNQEKHKMKKKMQMLFLSSVAHDLRTPLNSAIILNSSLRRFVEHNEEALKILLVQKSSCDFMVNLIEDILDLSKM